MSLLCLTLVIAFTSSGLAMSSLPPIPPLKSLPLPAKLTCGLFLFQSSVQRRDKVLCEKVLNKAENILRKDPLICMELGSGLEAGGVFSSASSIDRGVHQLVMEFQINGGNSWAQCRCHGLKIDSMKEAEIISLSVSNMDAAFNGGWADVTLPRDNDTDEKDDDEYLKKIGFS